MTRTNRSRWSSVHARMLAAVMTSALVPLCLEAQTTTAMLRGSVRTAGKAALAPGTVITAVNTANGFTTTAVARPDGTYNLALEPATYTITALSPTFGRSTKSVRVQVGQALDLDFTLAPVAEASAFVEVTGTLTELQSAEVATNVATEQIENLPVGNRNFLNYAALAPGIRLSTDELNQSFSSGGQSNQRVNIFIDGTSFKSDLLQGGTVGQDSSRGNPFPLTAVQEFRVMTENYKAEYQKASGAVISAVTKSGGNEFHGDLFAYYQDKGLVANNPFAEKRGEKKPTYERWQEGLSLGGPIIKDKMHFFVSYEGNQQTRDNRVYLGGNTAATMAPALAALLKSKEGTFDSPFRSNLFFGKIDYQIDAAQILEFTLNNREEHEKRDFGAQTSFDNGSDMDNSVTTVSVKHKLVNPSWVNEVLVSHQRSEWNPRPINRDQVGLNYEGIMTIGGHSDEQDFVQKRTSIRDDFSLVSIQDHTLKFGVNLDFMDYKIQKFQAGNPMYHFQTSVDPTMVMPAFAEYGVGNPDLSATNREFGWYAQDDWKVTPRLLVNLGVRWDYESNMFNEDYVTPTAVRDALKDRLPARYFTDGNQRKAYYGAFQPRVGFSYDLTGSGKSFLFGGAGRYYDRETFNNVLDEKFRLQWGRRTFYFSADGNPRNGTPTIQWNPSYLTKAGLNSLIDQGIAPKPEVFLLDNDSRPAYSDQFSFGARTRIGEVNASVTFTDVRSHNSITWIWGDRNANLQQVPVPGYQNVLISDTKRTWYEAMFLVVEKPYTAASGWGAGFRYTLSNAKQTGNDLFSLDFVNADAYGKHPTPDDERHRVVMDGMVDLPWGFRLSGMITLGSGVPYNVYDVTNGWDYSQRHFYFGGGRPLKYSFIIPDFWAYRSVDLKLQKDVKIGKSRLGVNVEALNIFNYHNYTYGWDSGYIDANSAASGKFGQPVDALVGRRVQFGVTYSF